MAKKKKSKKSSYRNEHDKFVREQNEQCFLENNQKIQYHSFILLEIIPLEKKSDLFKGLDRLYAGAPAWLQSRLNYKKILSRSHSKLFQRDFISLPDITTNNLKTEIPPICVFRDLGNNIKHYKITIYDVLPSTTILQVQVILDGNPSKKINDVIYKYHKEVKDPPETQRKDATIYGPKGKKESEIYAFRKGLHKEAVEFLSRYFEGYFFELSKSYLSVVPTIDIFSLEYPTKEEDISGWIIKNTGFSSCLSTPMIPYYTFEYENYLLCLETKRDFEFENHIAFYNKKTDWSNYSSLDSAIGRIKDCSFDLLAINRWARIQEEVVGSLNEAISEEILNIDEKFDKTIKKAKSIFKKTFLFNRFVSEFKICGPVQYEFPFKNIKDERYPGREVEFFEELKKEIESRLKKIQDIIDSFNRQHETIFNLKNVEFSKNTQNEIIFLTTVVVVLALVDIFLMTLQNKIIFLTIFLLLLILLQIFMFKFKIFLRVAAFFLILVHIAIAYYQNFFR